MKLTNWIFRLAPFGSLFAVLAISPAAMTAAGTPYATSGTLTIVAQNAGNPDDVAVAPDDTIYFSDLTLHRVMRVASGGKVEPVSPALQEPEGI
ncbi:MAG TPA: hypothetical protein VKQ72_01585, partial [Aggregatilineales bacterium]|nr:hypothetical protein [Aggregatilineales bacterium]